MNKAEIEMKLARAIKDQFGENAVEYAVGLLASLTTSTQLEVVLRALRVEP